jgi:serine/threonine-protein kinase
VGPRTDVYGAAVVLWQALTGRRLFEGTTDGEIVNKILSARVEPPSSVAPDRDIPRTFDAVTLRGLERDPALRHPSARDFARSLERVGPLASSVEVGQWVGEVAEEALRTRSRIIDDLVAAAELAVPPSVSALGAVVATGAAAPRAGRRWRTLAVLGFVVVAIAILVARRQAETGTTATAEASSVGEGELASPPSQVVTADAPRSADSDGATEVAGNASASATGSHAKGAASMVSRSGKARTAPAATAQRGCDPPYFFNPAGARRYKPECL